ncbi:hypothetical protein JKN29_001642 [Enterococcus faecalis]|nr:hypothetical protein [Enterococcus faecalis]
MDDKKRQKNINQLLEKKIVLVTIDGKKVIGLLKRVTKYELYVEQLQEEKKTGQTFVFFKHAVKYMRYK